MAHEQRVVITERILNERRHNMDLSEEAKLNTIKEATKSVKQLANITEVCIMHREGADAEACMERIWKIISEE